MPTPIQCPSCKGSIGMPEGVTGGAVRCPLCAAVIAVRAATQPTANASQAPSEVIILPPTAIVGPPPLPAEDLIEDSPRPPKYDHLELWKPSRSELMQEHEAAELVYQQRAAIRRLATVIASSIGSIVGGAIGIAAFAANPTPAGQLVGIAGAVIAGLFIGGVLRVVAELFVPAYPRRRSEG